MLRRVRQVVRALQWRQLRLGSWPCPLCGHPVQIHLNSDESGTRCLRCGASAVTQSIVAIIRLQCPALARADVYEMSSRGALVAWLIRHSASLITSEYVPDAVPGSSRAGGRCEDVQQLSFAVGMFDLCTSTEVFEHVPDDLAGFAEVRRVLRPDGQFIFTVPLTGMTNTIERAQVIDGQVTHRLVPEYHGDPFSRSEKILCFRNYGNDILDRLHTAGFSRATVRRPDIAMFGHARTVVVAEY